ncbi:MAG: hypothetical protein KatS3mg129_2252 [Leptospiraceae bacterium]|nr:MAG: hypothetical protein KatS3mg129_2252 [Leptospiraceae bacterium]
MLKKINILLLLTFFITCKREYTGDFAWRSIDQNQFNYIEKMLISPQEFYTGRKNLYFGTQETIWWIYRFHNKFYLKPKFLVVLYSEIKSPQPVEIDLRIVQPDYQDGFYFIKQYYPPLEPGKYLLKIAAYEDKIPFDQVEFIVLPQEEIRQISGPVYPKKID